jgi:hypothetical protein
LLALNRGVEALVEASRAPDGAFRSWALAIVHRGLDHAAESDAALQELIEKYSENAAYQIAEVCATRGETDRAFDWLERAYKQRDPGLIDLSTSRFLRSLQGDPRWSAFLKKMGLEV